MKEDYERLEGTYKISRIKKLEKVAYIPQVIGIIVVFFLIMYFSGLSLKPFYLPLFWPSVAALLWILILAIETFIFRLMEIRERESKSAKFLMADRSMKKSYTIIIIAAIFLAITATPFITNQIEDQTVQEGTVNVIGGEDDIYFTTTGRFDYLMKDNIHLEIENILDSEANQAEVEVFILKEEYYQNDQTSNRLNGQTGDPKSLSMDQDFDYDLPKLSFQEYRVLLRSDTNVSLSYEISNDLPRNRMFPYTLLSLGFIISHSAWAYTMYPIKKKHADEAIYK